MPDIEILEDVLSGLMVGALIDPHRQSNPEFKGAQCRERHWSARTEDMRRPCLEDKP